MPYGPSDGLVGLEQMTLDRSPSMPFEFSKKI